MLASILRYAVPASFIFALFLLAIQTLRTSRFGKPRLYSEGAGDPKKGVIYSFGKGMMPWEKESAVKHLPSYIGGIFYHLGIFGGLFYLLVTLVSIDLPAPVLLFMRIVLAAGVISGAALLLKRIFSTRMRVLSCPDDFAANIIVNIFVLAALLHTFYPGITHFFFPVAIIMFLYMPLGKIRHCFFFFYIRILFGMFYGRRDIFPPKPHEE